MDWISANWEIVLLVFFIAEKLVKILPGKWNDILLDGLKAAFEAIFKKKI